MVRQLLLSATGPSNDRTPEKERSLKIARRCAANACLPCKMEVSRICSATIRHSLPGPPTASLTAGSIGNVLGDYGNFNAPRTWA